MIGSGGKAPDGVSEWGERSGAPSGMGADCHGCEGSGPHICAIRWHKTDTKRMSYAKMMIAFRSVPSQAPPSPGDQSCPTRRCVMSPVRRPDAARTAAASGFPRHVFPDRRFSPVRFSRAGGLIPAVCFTPALWPALVGPSSGLHRVFQGSPRIPYCFCRSLRRCSGFRRRR